MAPREYSINDFGLLIAYVLPGFAALWGCGYFAPSLRAWINAPPVEAPTLGGFLYTTVASIAAGMTVSTVRWLIVDAIHHRTGVRPPAWDFSLLEQNVTAYNVLNEIHYKYYQFHSNMLVSLTLVYITRRVSLGPSSAPLGWLDLGFLGLGVVFFLGSRDNLRKYYARTGQLLRVRDRQRGPQRK